MKRFAALLGLCLWGCSTPLMPSYAWLVACLCLCGCSTPLAPSLALRFVNVLHRRTLAAAPARGRDWALTAELSFFQRPKPQLRGAPRWLGEVPDPVVSEPDECGIPALCAWASASERTALVMLGVEP
jgi:hypothetical protein